MIRQQPHGATSQQDLEHSASSHDEDWEKDRNPPTNQVLVLRIIEYQGAEMHFPF